MKKIGLFVIGSIAAITILCSLGPLTGLAISAAILFTGVHFYLQSNSTFSKIIWALVAISGLLTAAANIPGFIGIAALAVIWVVYRKWKHSENETFTASDDPFTNFEKQWNELTK